MNNEKWMVRNLGATIGFARLAELTEECWGEHLAALGSIGGELTVGPCRASLEQRGLKDCQDLLNRYDNLKRSRRNRNDEI